MSKKETKKKGDRAIIVEGEITPLMVKKIAGGIALLLLGWFIFQSYSVFQMGDEIPLQEAVKKIKEDEIEKVTIKDGTVLFIERDKDRSYVILDNNSSFTEVLQRDGLEISEIKAEISYAPQGFDISIMDLFYIIAMALVGFGIFSFVRTLQKQGSGEGMMSFGKSKAAVIIGKRPKITFKDVAGAKEAKEEVAEIVDFLRNPKEFFKMGARIPRGVLLVGKPGTGKTLLARAVAGEAKVPFFHTSGPEFEEMLVGAGASRVRDLFKRARSLSPSIIFIDEIDAVARRRGMDYKASHSEQTLNQILVEMDGFEKRDAVIVIAATNRPDVLDPAILRPGRFDRNVKMALPDVGERLEILKVHARNKKFADNVDLNTIAKFAIGYSGADLENVLNEAAILAVRAKKKEITEEELKEATLKVSMGAKRGSMMMTEKDLQITAYHEAGHAVVAAYLENSAPISTITIVPRGESLGMTTHSERENVSLTRGTIEDKIAIFTAGRVAESLIFGDKAITAGASNDIEQATKLATMMVKEIGMSSDIGFIQVDKQNEYDAFSSKPKVSNKKAELVEIEIKKIIDEQYKVAEEILKRIEHRDSTCSRIYGSHKRIWLSRTSKEGKACSKESF